MLPLLLLLVPAPSAGQHCLREVDKLGSELRAEVEELKAIVREMKTEKDAEVELRDKKDAEVEALKASMKEMKAEMDLPTVIICAYKDYWMVALGATLPYDRFITNFNNADQENGGDGVLDLDTGVFTCLTAAHYTINFSGYSYLLPDDDFRLELYHNGEVLAEGRWYDSLSSSAGGYSYSQGARTLVTHVITPLHSSLPRCRSCTLLSETPLRSKASGTPPVRCTPSPSASRSPSPTTADVSHRL
jgi:hypothetical protein